MKKLYTNARLVQDPVLWDQTDKAIHRLELERAALNDVRSVKFVEQAWQIAGRLASENKIPRADHAIVIGAAHVAKMLKEYERRACDLYVIQPASAEPILLR